MEERLMKRLMEVTIALNVIQKRKHAEAGYTHPADEVLFKEGGRKFALINIGTSGAWMIEKATGEIYNIKGYGVPDYNKKKKADIGNIYTVNPEDLHEKRYNYLR